jgi:hypothetical protein
VKRPERTLFSSLQLSAQTLRLLFSVSLGCLCLFSGSFRLSRESFSLTAFFLSFKLKLDPLELQLSLPHPAIISGSGGVFVREQASLKRVRAGEKATATNSNTQARQKWASTKKQNKITGACTSSADAAVGPSCSSYKRAPEVTIGPAVLCPTVGTAQLDARELGLHLLGHNQRKLLRRDGRASRREHPRRWW